MHKEKGQLFCSPSDLAGHVACSHLTNLDLLSLESGATPAFGFNPTLDLLIELGHIHEQKYLESQKQAGKIVVELNGAQDHVALNSAMTAGADVIYQAFMGSAPWQGKADFLIKVESPSKFGPWSYEVADTKLSSTTKAATVMQLCLYSELLAEIQGVEPIRFHVIKPGKPFDTESYRIHDFGAYYRMAKKRFLEFIGEQKVSESYPQPCSHCEVCKWSSTCESQLRNDDHLGFVAGIRKSQLIELHEIGIKRLQDFASSPTPHPGRPKRGSLESLTKVHLQAKVQMKGRSNGRPEFEFETFEPSKGFCLLPQPNPGDIFFDIEGNPRALNNGLEYLLGYVEINSRKPRYVALWALDKAQEKANFQAFMQYLVDRIEKYPEMFIYHYAPYEPSALKRLALEHATYEDELDDILRAERFVDLYSIVKQSIRASVESYSIKQMEQFYGFKRKESLDQARYSLSIVERLIELDIVEQIGSDAKESVERYNEDDCQSTLALREWLELIRLQFEEQNQTVPRRVVKQHDANPQALDVANETKQVFESLIQGIEDGPQDEFESCRWLLAHMLEYFRREQKVAWWEFFRLRDLNPDDLFYERAAIASLQHVSELPLIGKSRIPSHRYSFPEQEVAMDIGDDVYDSAGNKIGKVDGLDLEAKTIDIKKTKATLEARPSDVFSFKSISPGCMPQALLELGKKLVKSTPTQSVPPSATFDLLARRLPRLKTLSLPLDGEISEIAAKLALDLDHSYLAIQGPPGAGKTHVGSTMIIALAQAGYRVGVTAVSHKVILNLLSKVIEMSESRVNAAHQISEPGSDFPETVQLAKKKADSIAYLDSGCVVGGTAWLWSDPAMSEQLDFLFIDEAGQMSLAMALAAGQSARNIVLLGDPQQLEQPQQGSHPHGSGVAALSHVLGDNSTISANAGLFLEDTWRLHPEICRFTSELYYDGRLRSKEGLDQQKILSAGGKESFGLRFLPVMHTGNENHSLEEVEEVRKLVDQYLSGGFSWVDRDGVKKDITLRDILIVAPYNSQVNALRLSLPQGARIGTVDKFQGQEAPIVIYSMTSSSIEDAPRGVTFLLNRNRMNVATSRAKCLAIVVGSPLLLAPSCSSPEQMKMANGLCRVGEFGMRA
ncbi:TM0106 family RecB-like putative nuclease [Pirellulaceae bacterium SH449]